MKEKIKKVLKMAKAGICFGLFAVGYLLLLAAVSLDSALVDEICKDKEL